MTLFNKRAYLDCAAGMSGNPSSPHEEGRRARQMLEDARTAIARLIEVQPDDVIFTSGATEANAIAILGAVHNFGLTKSQISEPGMSGLRKSEIAAPTPHVLYLPSAHASIVENIKLLAERGVEVEELPIRGARVDCEKLQELVRPETKLVSMEAVCGETGVIWNTREVAQVLRDFVNPSSDDGFTKSKHGRVLLHVDASQAPLTEKITRAHFGADLVTFDAAKVGPLHSMGALIAHRTIPLEPLYRGGGQERGLRPGTEAPELAACFAAALASAVRTREAFRARAEKDRAHLVELIKNAVSDVYINEGCGVGLPVGRQAPNILNLSLPGRDTDYLVALLDEAGFAVSTRSACETDSEEGSRAVFALTGDTERARATLRISWCPDTRTPDLARFAKALAEIARGDALR